MFGLYFGNYLVEKNKISQQQFEDIMMQQQNSRAKLGFIAVSEKLLTSKQAEEINNLQKTMDQRFGDIAIEKGFLLHEEVTYLLNMQGNPYIKFIQLLTENKILALNEIESLLEEYKKEYRFSDTDMDAIKSGDIDRILPVFVDMDIPFTSECISLTIRNITRFINNNIMLKKAYTVTNYSSNNLAFQEMIGDHSFFVGFSSQHNELLHIAEPFAKESFPDVDEDAFDAVCEFINCSNGLYASKLSLDDINIDMTPPQFSKSKVLSSDVDIYVIPIIIHNQPIDLLVATDNQVKVD